MKRYAVQYQANGHWVTAAIYQTKKEAESYALHALPEYATRVILCLH